MNNDLNDSVLLIEIRLSCRIIEFIITGPSLYGIYKIGWMGNTSFEINFVQTLVFSAVIVAVDPVAVSIRALPHNFAL
jgi:NhaP-type Na+/H+ or K+/H+ antiporter